MKPAREKKLKMNAEQTRMLLARTRKSPHNSNTCIFCGAEIPEGRMVCYKCEREHEYDEL